MPPSFPRKRESSDLPAPHFWVPAFAGTTMVRRKGGPFAKSGMTHASPKQQSAFCVRRSVNNNPMTGPKVYGKLGPNETWEVSGVATLAGLGAYGVEEAGNLGSHSLMFP